MKPTVQERPRPSPAFRTMGSTLWKHSSTDRPSLASPAERLSAVSGHDSLHNPLRLELCLATAGPSHLSRARVLWKLLTHNPCASPRYLLLQPTVTWMKKILQNYNFLLGRLNLSIIYDLVWMLPLQLFPHNSQSLTEKMGFPGGSMVENPPAMQETWVRSLSGEGGNDNLLQQSWLEISWTEEPGGYSPGAAKGLTWQVAEHAHRTHSRWAAVWLASLVGTHVARGPGDCGQEERRGRSHDMTSLPCLHSAAAWPSQKPPEGGAVVIPPDRWRGGGTSLHPAASAWQVSVPDPARSRSEATSSLSRCSLWLGPRRATWGSGLLNWGLRTQCSGSVKGICLILVFFVTLEKTWLSAMDRFCHAQAKVKQRILI